MMITLKKIKILVLALAIGLVSNQAYANKAVCDLGKISIGKSIGTIKSDFKLEDLDFEDSKIDNKKFESVMIRVSDICDLPRTTRGDVRLVFGNNKIVEYEISLRSSDSFILYGSATDVFGESPHKPNFAKDIKFPYADFFENDDASITYKINKKNGSFREYLKGTERDYGELIADRIRVGDEENSNDNSSLRGR